MSLGRIYRDEGEIEKEERLLEDALARDRKFLLSPNVALVRDIGLSSGVQQRLPVVEEPRPLSHESVTLRRRLFRLH